MRLSMSVLVASERMHKRDGGGEGGVSALCLLSARCAVTALNGEALVRLEQTCCSMCIRQPSTSYGCANLVISTWSIQ